MQRFERQRHVGEDAPVKGQRAGFLRSEDGSLIVFGLFVFLLMAVVAGMAVDFMRFETQRTRLQSTLDRAILAASSLDQTADPEYIVMDYFNKAGLGSFIDASQINVYENDRLIDDTYAGAPADSLTSRRVEAAAKMTIGTTFLKFSGIDFLGAPAAGTAEESASLTEISLVLDISTSMSWNSASGHSKIYELRNAAKKFINIVLCDPGNPDNTTDCKVEPGTVSVNLIPYSEQVTVGEDLLSSFNATSEHNYSSCITFDAEDYEVVPITPTQLLQREGDIDPWSGGNNASDGNRTCRKDAWREITAVSGDAAALRDAIGDLQASGYTSIDVGMKWGAAFLDPAVVPVVTDLVAANKTDEAYEGRPLDYDISRSTKVIVLMTDGENTTQHYLYDGFRSGPSPVWRTKDKVGSSYYYSVYNESTDLYRWDHNGAWEDHPYGTGITQECHDEWVRTGRWGGYWTEVCEDVPEPGNGAEQMDFAELWHVKSWSWWERYELNFLPSPGSSYGNSTKNARL
ncbi:MAG: Tad domain-containing protein, partial [Maritimibacter sp.]|nr:Tad domain-containing protein [Maritimibacter sp.]